MTKSNDEDNRQHNKGELNRTNLHGGPDYIRWSYAIATVCILGFSAMIFFPEYAVVPDALRDVLHSWTGAPVDSPSQPR